jgi:hypothetical protein
MDGRAISPRAADMVYNAHATGTSSWVWDVALDASRHPVIIYATFPSAEDHLYWYARWTGTAWVSHLLTHGGATISPGSAAVVDVVASVVRSERQRSTRETARSARIRSRPAGSGAFRRRAPPAPEPVAPAILRIRLRALPAWPQARARPGAPSPRRTAGTEDPERCRSDRPGRACPRRGVHVRSRSPAASCQSLPRRLRTPLVDQIPPSQRSRARGFRVPSLARRKRRRRVPGASATAPRALLLRHVPSPVTRTFRSPGARPQSISTSRSARSRSCASISRRSSSARGSGYSTVSATSSWSRRP